MTPTLDAALDYAARGWPAFPVGSAEDRKRPRIRDWPNAASTDAEELRDWFTRWPEAGVAIVTGYRSGLIAIDLDDDDVGGDAYGALLLEHGAPGSAYRPDGAIIRTGRNGGGWRLLFALPAGVSIRKGSLASGVEYMGEGGSAIMPPSRHPSGRLYVWREDPPDELPRLAPAWVALMTRPARAAQPPSAPTPARLDGTGTPYGLAGLRAELERIANAQVGERNHVLNRAAFAIGALVASGHLEAESAIAQIAQAGLDVGLSADEVRATVRSGVQAGMANPRETAA